MMVLMSIFGKSDSSSLIFCSSLLDLRMEKSMESFCSGFICAGVSFSSLIFVVLVEVGSIFGLVSSGVWVVIFSGRGCLGHGLDHW